MSLAENNYAEETKPLFRMLETESFRFVLVRYNHYSLLEQLRQDLKQRYPQRPMATIDGANTTYRNLMDTYYNTGSGFFYIHNFRALLNNPDVYPGLNQRRDKLAQYPIAIIAFMEPPAPEHFAAEAMEKIPDLFSFRSLIMDLKTETVATVQPMTVTGKAVTMSTLGGNTQASKQAELDRLLLHIAETDGQEIAYLRTLYEQVVVLQKDLGKYSAAIDTYTKLLGWATNGEEKANFLIERGDVYTALGLFREAVNDLEKAYDLAKKYNHIDGLEKSLRNLGVIYSINGEHIKALGHFKQYEKFVEELSQTRSENVVFKNWMVIANKNLGMTYFSLGDVQGALGYFQKSELAVKELLEKNPKNTSFLVELAVTNGLLGDCHSAQGDLIQALSYYEKSNRLFKELFESYPENLTFKSSLGISFQNLGKIYSAIGDIQKASEYFQLDLRLSMELFKSYPENTAFKIGLAFSYLISGLNIQNGSSEKARIYYQQAKTLYEQLVASGPSHETFEHNLALVNNRLAALGG